MDCLADAGQHRLVVSLRRRRGCENERHKHLGGGWSVPDAVQLRDPKAQLHAIAPLTLAGARCGGLFVGRFSLQGRSFYSPKELRQQDAVRFPRRRIMRRISFLMFVVFACFASAPWLQAQGEFTSFDAPGAGTGPGQGTGPNQMTAAGTIVGNYVDTNFVTHGFVRTAQGTFTTIDVPGALRTQALGMTQARIVGFYRDTSRVRRGYVLGPDGKFVTFDAPGAGTGPGQGTFPEAINVVGMVSGNYVDSNNVNHGFLRAADGTITTFDVPQAAGTIPAGSNPSGATTGQYFDSNFVSHGFVRAADGTIVT